MRRAPLMLFLFLTASCTQDTSLLAPAGDILYTTGSTTPTLRIRGQTFGPNGEILVPGEGGMALVGSQTIVTSFGSFTWQYLQSSALSSGGSGGTYNGGHVHVSVLDAGQYEVLGTVVADMSNEAQALEAAGQSFKLQAYANQHCTFVSWRTGSGTIRTNPAYVSSGSVIAQFSCSDDYGTNS